MSAMLEAKNLWFSYDGGESWALQDINLEVEKGEFVAVLGMNGCGKSTLAKHFNAILTPTKGDVIARGINTKDTDRLFDIRQKVGMVFQNPDNQIVATVVEEDVAFALENIGVPREEIRRRIDIAMKDVGIYELRNKAPHNLSGGQKQRVAIAGIMALRPDCIVLDEPTAMLDPSGRKSVMDTIKYLNKQFNITVVLITHHMDEAAQSDRVVVMSKGKIAGEGTPKEIFSKVEWVKSFGLDVPQTCELEYELNKLGYSVPMDAISIDECADELVKFLEE
jgi:energy-coupling factor transport system ATP-binding protein